MGEYLYLWSDLNNWIYVDHNCISRFPNHKFYCPNSTYMYSTSNLFHQPQLYYWLLILPFILNIILKLDCCTEIIASYCDNFVTHSPYNLFSWMTNTIDWPLLSLLLSISATYATNVSLVFIGRWNARGMSFSLTHTFTECLDSLYYVLVE